MSLRGDQTTIARQQAIDAFNNDPAVGIAVCSLTAAGVGVNMQASSNVVLAELSWTAAEQTQAIDRVHRIGQDEPVTAWRIIAAHTIDTKIAELIDSKQGLAARALDGEAVDPQSSDSVQLSALMHVLRQDARRGVSSIRSMTMAPLRRGHRRLELRGASVHPVCARACGRAEASGDSVGRGSVAARRTPDARTSHEDRHPHQRRRLPGAQRGHPRRRPEGDDDTTTSSSSASATAGAGSSTATSSRSRGTR